MPFNLSVLTPLQNGLACELSAIVRDNCFRLTQFIAEALKLPGYSVTRNRCVRNQCEVFTSEVVNYAKIRNRRPSVNAS